MQSSSAYPSRDPSERYRTTRLGVIERLGDPYLTDDDRWVLRQFLRFLSGRSPEPDLRVTSLRTKQHSPDRSGLRGAPPVSRAGRPLTR